MAAAPAAPAFPSSIRLCKAFRDIIVQARPASGCAIPNKPNPDPIIGMDCSRDGSVILTYSKHQLSIYDVIAGVLRRKILVKDEITDAKLKPTDPSFAFLLLKTPGRGVLEEEDFDSSSSELEREVLDQEREDLTDPVRRGKKQSIGVVVYENFTVLLAHEEDVWLLSQFFRYMNHVFLYSQFFPIPVLIFPI